jgi:hypothetical protein
MVINEHKEEEEEEEEYKIINGDSNDKKIDELIKTECLNNKNVKYIDSCDDDFDYDIDYSSDEKIKEEEEEGSILDHKQKRTKLLNEKKLKIKKIQINLRNEEAKLILLKRLYYSQKFPQQTTNGVNNSSTTSSTINNKQGTVQQPGVLNKNSHQIRPQQQVHNSIMNQQRMNSSQSQINHRSTDIMNRNKKVKKILIYQLLLIIFKII